ncbi:MBL fold metallo-hydrolase [Saccharomonospora piscinae]|uniref:MBL fold metallo-hydrolase n=1 Tax=Saccharomonospora piscinae TaxID=687388 RepID=UPI000465C57A|nr:MBL fold metallo-hydrolase [Saccharomonospora piscinae]
MAHHVRRRTVMLGGMAAGLAAAGVAGHPAGAATSGSGGPAPTVTRGLGGFEVVALLDAHGPFFLTMDEAFDGATEHDWDRARRVDPGAFGPERTWNLNFRCFAVRLPSGGYALVDAGVGPEGSPASAWAPVPGELPRRLTEAGIGSCDVRIVVLTHLHADHAGWSVSPEGMPYFPNARYVVQRTEISALERNGDETILPYVVEPLRDSGQLDPVGGGVCLARTARGGLMTVPTPGHTPGHQSVLVRDHGEQILITGDVLVHAVQLVAPNVAYRFEADPALARRTRRALLDAAGEWPTWLATAHLTRPFLRAESGDR